MPPSIEIIPPPRRESASRIRLIVILEPLPPPPTTFEIFDRRASAGLFWTVAVGYVYMLAHVGIWAIRLLKGVLHHHG